MRTSALGVGFAALILSGCAGLSVGPVKDDNSARGYRYYQPAPFLFVRSDGKGGLSSEIIYLPDTTQKMQARPYAVLASNDATLSFSNGMLTAASITADETVVPVAFLDALTKVAGAAIAADQPKSPQATAPVPYLFKIIVRTGSIELKGGPALGPDGVSKATISVSISTSGEK
jgi:hypothetical protein